MSEATTVERETVSQTDFVRTWVEVHKSGGTLDDVSTKLAMNKNSVQARANTYKKKGINLPKLSRATRTKRIDVDELNALIEGMLSQPEDTD